MSRRFSMTGHVVPRRHLGCLQTFVILTTGGRGASGIWKREAGATADAARAQDGPHREATPRPQRGRLVRGSRRWGGATKPAPAQRGKRIASRWTGVFLVGRDNGEKGRDACAVATGKTKRRPGRQHGWMPEPRAQRNASGGNGRGPLDSTPAWPGNRKQRTRRHRRQDGGHQRGRGWGRTERGPGAR